MGLRSFVESQVDSAFAQIGDLKTTMTFSGKSGTSYNPETGSVENTGATSMVVGGVIESSYSVITEEGYTGYHMDLLFNRKEIEVSKLNTFDHVEVNGTSHPIVNFVDDGYTVTATVSLR